MDEESRSQHWEPSIERVSISLRKVFVSFAPTVSSIVAACAINVVPAYRAFGLEQQAWAQAGWAFYFFLVPLGVGLVFFGLVTTVVCFVARSEKHSKLLALLMSLVMLAVGMLGTLLLSLMD